MSNDRGGAPMPANRLQQLVLLGLLCVGAAGLWVWKAEEVRVTWHLGTLRGDPSNREAVVALEAMGDSVRFYLERDLRSADPDIRLYAVLATTQLRSRWATQELIQASGDADFMVAANAYSGASERDAGWLALPAFSRWLTVDAPLTRAGARKLAGAGTGLPWWAFGKNSVATP